MVKNKDGVYPYKNILKKSKIFDSYKNDLIDYM